MPEIGFDSSTTVVAGKDEDDRSPLGNTLTNEWLAHFVILRNHYLFHAKQATQSW